MITISDASGIDGSFKNRRKQKKRGAMDMYVEKSRAVGCDGSNSSGDKAVCKEATGQLE